MAHNKFGGKWTEEKLAALSEYLISYLKILKKYPRFYTWYIDGFAGTGFIQKKLDDQLSLFDEEDQLSITQYRTGSVIKALELQTPFDHYLFIEKDKDCFGELSQTVSKFVNRKIDLRCNDANVEIIDWINTTPRDNHRAVLFLDPYGMAVNWSTMEAIAKSKIIDTWILFPLGSGVNRLLTKDGIISDSWQQKLDQFFGSHDWFDKFYQTTGQSSFFDNNQSIRKVVNEKEIGYYFYRRLGSIFYKVSPYCGILENEKGSALFLFFFAASNKSGSDAAIRIATWLIRKRFKNVYFFEN